MKIKINHHLIYFTIIIALVAALAQLFFSFKVEPYFAEREARQVNVYYNKDITANEMIVDQIYQADRFVYFAIYTFTRTDIKDALIIAKNRGLDVQGIIDKQQTAKIDAQKEIVQELQDAGIKIGFQDHDAIMHLKTLVTDKSYVSGSYNWTASATDSNDEILEIGRDEDLRIKYQHVLAELFDRYPPR